MERESLYRTVWRWHFYAGLFVVPMVLILAATGGIYLFKPQVERWEERAYQGLAMTGAVSPSAQREAALAVFPDAQFTSYRLPELRGDAAMVELALAGDKGTRQVFVSPEGKVLGAMDPDWRPMEIAHDIHGELLIGKWGAWVVELAASWAIVMIVTGLYLWWPRGAGLGGVLWPRLGLRGRLLWRDLHAVTGFWVSVFALVLLLSGLPWTSVWSGAFDMVRQEMGWVKGDKGWSATGSGPAMGGAHAMHNMGHDHSGMARMHTAPAGDLMLNRLVAQAAAEHLTFPVLVTPPSGAPQGGSAAATEWTVRSDAQNRPLRTTIRFDGATGQELSREAFADKHAIDQVVAYGIAWHEGQLFGLVNQLIGAATALALLTVSISGFVMWRKRKPGDLLGAPPVPEMHPNRRAVTAIFVLFFLLLPLFALSILVLWIFERLALPRLPGFARWLGLRQREVGSA